MVEDAGGSRHQFRVIGSVISCLGERRGYVDSPFITNGPIVFSCGGFFFPFSLSDSTVRDTRERYIQVSDKNKIRTSV